MVSETRPSFLVMNAENIRATAKNISKGRVEIVLLKCWIKMAKKAKKDRNIKLRTKSMGKLKTVT